MKAIVIAGLLLKGTGVLLAQAPVPSVVQHKGNECGSSKSCTVTFAAPTVTGRKIFVAARIGGTNPTVSVTDAGKNLYALAGTCAQATDHFDVFYYTTGNEQPASSVTVSGGGVSTRVVAAELGGTDKLDFFACASGLGVSPDSGPGQVSAGALVFGAISTADSVSVTAGKGFALLDSAGKIALESAAIQSAASAEDATASLQSANGWAASLVSFLPAAAPPPPSVSATLKITYDDGSPFSGSAQVVTVDANPDGTLLTTVVASSGFDGTGTASASVPLAAAKSYIVFVLDKTGAILYRSPLAVQGFSLVVIRSATLTAKISKASGALLSENYQVQ